MLREREPWLHSAVWRYLVCEQPGVIGGGLRAVLDDACERLARFMPPRIRVPVHAMATGKACNGKGRWANGFEQGRRNQALRAEWRDGVSTSRLAVKYQLSRRSVQKIVKEARE